VVIHRRNVATAPCSYAAVGVVVWMLAAKLVRIAPGSTMVG
jgi:hypothetical protein